MSQRFIYRIAADALFVFHFFVVMFVLFGWSIYALKPWYIGLLIITLIQHTFLGYCVLSKWEFNLRKKFSPEIDYNSTWVTFYTRRWSETFLTDGGFRILAIFFLITSLVINFLFLLR